MIIGSNNSAHDIAAALWENDADVTMVQRSSTHIVRSDTLMEIGCGSAWNVDPLSGGIGVGLWSAPLRSLDHSESPWVA